VDGVGRGEPVEKELDAMIARRHDKRVAEEGSAKKKRCGRRANVVRRSA
jgi:hypothetical protein